MEEEQVSRLIAQASEQANIGMIFWQVVTSICVTVSVCVFLYFNVRAKVIHLEHVLENGLTAKVDDLRERIIRLETTCHMCNKFEGRNHEQ